jgi:hypothetical protein
MLRRLWLLAALLACASPVLAQQYKDARRLAGPTAFYKPRLTNAASLKRMADRQAADIRKVMTDAGMPEVTDAFLAAMSKGTSTIASGNCSNVAPGDGLVECTEPVGAMYDWMAYRPLVKGKRVPDRLQRVRWAGKASFLAFLVRVTVSDKLYTFIVPKPCGNFSLVSVTDSPAAVAARAQAARDQAARDQAARDQAARDQAARDQAARDQAARDQAARDQAARDQAARDQAARDQAARDQAARDQAARDQAARDQQARNNAQPPAPGAAQPSSSAAGANGSGGAGKNDKTYPPDNPSTPFFADVLLGGETRNRPADLAEGKRTPFTQGSGQIGLKIGLHKRFESKWEVGVAGGLGAVFLFDRDTTNQWPWFVDIEVNRFIGRAFIGTGLSFWDITRGDLWTPAPDLRFGLPIGHHPQHPIYFVGEGRWYFWNRTNLDTHRQMWAGLRFDF